MDVAIALTITAAITCIAEFALWMLFKQKVKPLSFPREFDTSYFRFFAMSRMRLVAIIHTIVLLVIVSLLYIFLW